MRPVSAFFGRKSAAPHHARLTPRYGRPTLALNGAAGAHAREDFPKRDDVNWLKHSYCWLDDDGRARLDYRPVHLQPLTNEVATIPPKERVY